jgi:tetraacyldisaccharide 4'-kinase
LWAAESETAPSWPLPAGPWREGRAALRRASLVVITRKVAGPAHARRALAGMPGAVALLPLAGLAALRTGAPLPLAALRGRTVVAATGIGDPDSFAAQLGALGTRVCRLDWPDHHAYRPRDLARLRAAAATADHLVVTEKDAVKLRPRWPGAWPDLLVASLGVTWEAGGSTVTAALDRALGAALASPHTPTIHRGAPRESGVARTYP